MKFNKLIPKFAVSCFFTVSFFSFSPAQAQLQFYTSPIADQEAEPGRSVHNVQNTGADAIIHDNEVIQVMAWDGDDPSFSWDFGNGTHKGYLPLQDPIGPNADPDVVLARQDNTNDLYALVVYIDSNQQIRWDRFTWDPGNQEFVYAGTQDDSGNLGTQGSCSYPNIDANSYGHVAVVWQEGLSETIHVEVTSPAFGFFQYDTYVTWTHVHGAYGDIDGTALFGGSGKIQGPSGNQLGDLVSKQLKVGEQNKQPDVAISDYADESVFITYIKHSADASVVPSEFKDHLVVQRESMPGNFIGTNLTYWDSSPFLGKPRIAASPAMSYNAKEDYELVVLKNPNGCGVVPYWEIWNYGVSTGLAHDGILVNETLTQEENLDPVVAYAGGDKITQQAHGVYTVAWTADVADQGIQKDILARMYQNYNGGNGFSVVNQQTDGVQHIPSIAGRFLNFQVMYEFFNEHDSFIGYKLSGKKAGAENLRVKANTSPTLYPNPFSKVINFNYTLGKGETSSEIVIYNATGSIIDRVPVSSKEPGNYTETIRMKENTPDGMYILKLNTSLKSQTLRATKIN